MQPYFFPYLGYFQLMHAVDCFVLYDDAQYMKGGWVNRNRLLVDGRAGWWTFPVRHDSHRLPIRERRYDRSEPVLLRLAAQLRHAYRRAPHFSRVQAGVEEWLSAPIANVADFNRHHLQALAYELGIDCRIVMASDLAPGRAGGGVLRVLEICRNVGATHYLNPVGGQSLYDAGEFGAAGLQLQFLHPRLPGYAQFAHPHVAALSIVDVLMFNEPVDVRTMLHGYEIEGSAGAAQ